MFFIDDIKSANKLKVENNIIQLTKDVESDDVISYYKSESSIYRNNVKIAEKITEFKVNEYSDEFVTISITVDNDQKFTVKYILGRGY